MKKFTLLALVILVAGCSLLGNPLETKIIGTWSMDITPTYHITFRKDGTMSNTDSATGTWKLDDKQLTMHWNGGVTSISTIVISGDAMVLSYGLIQVSFTRL